MKMTSGSNDALGGHAAKLCTLGRKLLTFSSLVAVLLVGCAPMGARGQGAGDVFVHLFEWKWVDIAKECERFLGPMGIKAVQVSPPAEHLKHDRDHKIRPWWERYQPLGYTLVSRSGNREEFAQMVSRCKDAGVDIYVDAVINHFAGAGAGRVTSTAGNEVNTSPPSFPNVPYGPGDFNDACDIQGWHYGNNADAVRNCRLSSLLDLKLSSSYVRGKIAEYMNDLISLGVAGFRIDAAKHMWPADLNLIFQQLGNVPGNNRRPFIFQEVIDLSGNEAITSSEYISNGLGSVTEFKYGIHLSGVIRKDNGQQLKYLRNFGGGWGHLPTDKAVVFVDNHDNQRGHGGGGNILTFREARKYKMANAFMLAWPHGYPKIMSSYDWEPRENDWIGPPADEAYNTNSPDIKADGTCGRGVPAPRGDNTVGTRWVCEHRWRQIYQMVRFRNHTKGMPVQNWWDNDRDQIAFSRGDKGFIAINNDFQPLRRQLRTGLPPGKYCDVISGQYVEDKQECTGKVIEVDDNSDAFIEIFDTDADPMIAIHTGARLGCAEEVCVGTPPKPAMWPVTSENFKRTVVFIKRQTAYGQAVFLRGGIDHMRRNGCTTTASQSKCAIPIKHRETGRRITGAPVCWQKNDDFLDWYGGEPNQGKCLGQAAQGSPLAWTTDEADYRNTVSNDGYGYTPLNKFGESHWMLDVDMDCSATEGGWFELKGLVVQGESQEWERDIYQERCADDVNFHGSDAFGSRAPPAKPPFQSKNHVALCGYINVFDFDSGSCRISLIPQFAQ